MRLKFLELNLENMVRNFYFFTIGAVIIGGITYFAVRNIGEEISALRDNRIPVVTSAYEIQTKLGEIALEAERYLNSADKTPYRQAFEGKKTEFKNILVKAMNGIAESEEGVTNLKEIDRRSEEFFKVFEGSGISSDEAANRLSQLKGSIDNFRNFSIKEMGNKFDTSKSSLGRALIIVILLTIMAIIGMFVAGFILQKAVGTPISTETEKLMKNSKDIEAVFGEISSGTKKQTDVVKTATTELEDMIMNIIQGSISLSVDKQAEITKTFAEFIKHFVERTSVEIAMGMLSISQQSKEARKGIEDFVREVVTVEENIKAQETAIGGMVDTLKSIVEANKEVKENIHSSTEAADKATIRASSGQERIGKISEQLQEVRNSSERVKEIIDSLAKITETIKILALNMSLKVEDVKDDTGKTYGFEAMSAKVQQLAEEVEGLLERSKDMITPTIQGIERVSIDANQTRELIDEVVRAIKVADAQSKAMAAQIDKQASDIDRVEIEAENLRALAHKTTTAVEAQGALTKDVDNLLKESEVLIDGINTQTQQASEGARKVNQLMEQLRQTVTSIEDGTGRLTEKSSQISDMFESIKGLAIKNMDGAERLEVVTTSIIDVSNKISEVVKGEAVE